MSGVRDPQGNTLGLQTLHFFSFDPTAPYLTLVSPVPSGTALVSGTEYTLAPDIRNGSASAPAATDVARVDYFRVTGTTETYLASVSKTPFAYKFVAPDAPSSPSSRRSDGTGRSASP